MVSQKYRGSCIGVALAKWLAKNTVASQKMALEEKMEDGALEMLLQPTQVKKSTKDLGLSTLCKLTEDQRLQRKVDFILFIEITTSSKTSRLLSCHIVQKMQRGAAIQAFLRCLPTKEPCPDSRVSITARGNTLYLSICIQRYFYACFLIYIPLYLSICVGMCIKH